MKICANCNTQNKESAHYCRHCGFVLQYYDKGDRTNSSDIKRVEDLESLVSAYEDKLEKLKEENEQQKQELSSLSNTNQALQDELSNTKTRLSEVEVEVINLSQENEELRKSKNTIHFLYILATVSNSWLFMGHSWFREAFFSNTNAHQCP